MASFFKRFNRKEKIYLGIVVACFLATLIFEPFSVHFFDDTLLNDLLNQVISLSFGSIATLFLLLLGKSKLLSPPQKLLYLLPALLVAVNNFPFFTYFAGEGGIVRTEWSVWLLFALSCLLTGFYEECAFRGVLFPLFARALPQNKRGLILSLTYSSLLFGVTHLLNLFFGAGVLDTLLQVVYSTLLGGLYAFLVVKTRSVLPAILTHALFNFCGLLLPTLGYGTWATWQNILIMLLPALFVGLFVLYSLIKLTEFERVGLYSKFGFIENTQAKGRDGDTV